MAIQRCPYCKAIIDEGAEYCTNCGTKLLFPEDEFVEEEIPGEKIIDVDEDITGAQQELEERVEAEKADEEIPPGDVEETGGAFLADEGEPVEENAEEVKPEEAAADVEEKDEPGEKVGIIEDGSVEAAADDEEKAVVEAKEEEEKKPAPKKKPAPRKRKSTKKKGVPKKKKKEESVRVVEEEVEKLEEPAEAKEFAEPDKLEEAEQPEEVAEEPKPEEEMPAAETEPEPEEEVPAAEAELRPEEAPEEAEKEAAPEDVFPFEPEYVEDEEPPAVQDALPDDDFEGMDAKRGLTDDLPEGFAEAIDEAREKAGEPLEEYQPEEDEEAPEDAEPIDEKLTPEPGTAEEKEWQTPPPVGEELKEPPTQEDETVQTGDIEDIVDEAEKEKEEIDDFIASIKKERNSVRGHIKSDTQDIPPWAANVQDGPLPEIPPTDEIVFREEGSDEEEVVGAEAADLMEPEEDKATEDEPSISLEEVGERPAPGYDTRSAFPETVDQQGLPFVATSDGGEEEGVDEEPEPRKLRVRRKPRPLGFGDWIKARIFDVVFVSALWFVALWISSQVLGISVFRIISDSTAVALAFLAVLLLIYFFFFLYFLGETLGNYLFYSDD